MSSANDRIISIIQLNHERRNLIPRAHIMYHIHIANIYQMSIRTMNTIHRMNANAIARIKTV